MKMADNKIRRSVNFDLGEEKLKKHYPATSYTDAYRKICNYFEANGFQHRQYSGYVSNEPLSDKQIISVMANLYRTLSWLDACVDKMDITNIGTIYDYKAMREVTTNYNQIEELFDLQEKVVSKASHSKEKEPTQ